MSSDYPEQGEDGSDQPDALETRRLVSSETAMKEIKKPEEDIGRDGNVLGSEGEVSAKTVARFLTLYPGMRLFCWVADKRFPSSYRPETRVSNLRHEQPFFYYACLILDYMFVIIAAAILLAAAIVVLYKTIWVGMP